MTYKELLATVATYGHGVFSLTMLPDRSNRHALKMHVYRNPELFDERKGTHGDVKLLRLTRRGFVESGASPARFRADATWDLLLDMALFNAYMVECGEAAAYRNEPHMKVTLGLKRIGLISHRWGITRDLANVDLLLTTEQGRRDLLADERTLAMVAAREGLSISEIMRYVTTAVTPTAFINLR